MKNIVLLALILHGAAFAGDWTLAEGTVHFTSIKNGNAPVNGTIPAKGTLSGDSIQVEVDLDNLITGDLARDINIKTWLFETAKNKMTVKGKVDTAAVPAAIGQRTTTTIKSQVHYRGLTADMDVPVALVRTGEKTISMVSNRNVVMTLESLGLMGKPLEMLIKICAHESVSPLAFLSFEGELKMK